MRAGSWLIEDYITYVTCVSLWLRPCSCGVAANGEKLAQIITQLWCILINKLSIRMVGSILQGEICLLIPRSVWPGRYKVVSTEPTTEMIHDSHYRKAIPKKRYYSYITTDRSAYIIRHWNWAVSKQHNQMYVDYIVMHIPTTWISM